MNHPWENPVARHAGRLVTRRGWPWGVAGLLLAAAALAMALQHYWMELPIYNTMQLRFGGRWLALTLLGETAVALPWAAVRGALLWRRLERDGHLAEYRRSRLSAAAIAGGALGAALYPVGALLALSLAVALWRADLPPAQVATAHLLLATQAAAFGALGLWLAGRVRYPALAIPLALATLALATGAIGLLEPFYRSLGDPSPWIYAALLPNPVTAVGNALETDVLRFSWLYEHLHAHEYFFLYPPAWQTGGAYLLATALLGARVVRRIARAEE